MAKIEDLEAHFQKYQPDQCIRGTRWLLGVMRALQPKVYVEIGCAHLATFAVYEGELPPDGMAIGVDIRSYTPWETYKSLSGAEVHLIKGSSALPETIAQVKQHLGDRQIDFLFIDGCHDYPEVKSDWENFGPLVRQGGVVAFHDCDIAEARRTGTRNDGRCGGQGAGMVVDELLRAGKDVWFVPDTIIGTAIVRL